MKCDLHVHTLHSGMCTVPVFRRICRESYSDPGEVYATLKRRGMDLVTVTDHDSIDSSERLRRHPDFFLSEEVTCHTSRGTECTWASTTSRSAIISKSSAGATTSPPCSHTLMSARFYSRSITLSPDSRALARKPISTPSPSIF